MRKMRRIRRGKSITLETLITSLLFSSTMVLLFAIVLSKTMYGIELRKAWEIIEQRNEGLTYFIDGYFGKVENAIDVLAADPLVRSGISHDATERERLLSLFRRHMAAHDQIAYIYSAYENGELVINDYTPPTEYDPLQRPWYTAAKKAAPEISIGTPYRDIIDEEWLISTGKAFDNGVVAIDTAIGKITSLLQERGTDYDSSYSLILDTQGTVLIHPDPQFVNRDLSEIIDQAVSLDPREGTLEYDLDGLKKKAYYHKVENIGWYVMTVVETKEIVRPIVRAIIPRITAVIAVSIILSIIQAVLLSAKFSRPVQALYSHLCHILQGRPDQPESSYSYPNNELGLIARDLGRLTEKELYAQANKLKQANELLESKNRELEILSTTDKLSGLYNRYKIDEEMNRTYQIARRYGRPFSILILDIDNFKMINDDFGHPAGDEVIRQIGPLLKNNLRPTDICGRWGGEEFIVVSPECDLQAASALGAKLRSLIADHDFPVSRPISVSIGGAVYTNGEPLSQIIRRADTKLYEVKGAGKNSSKVW